MLVGIFPSNLDGINGETARPRATYDDMSFAVQDRGVYIAPTASATFHDPVVCALGVILHARDDVGERGRRVDAAGLALETSVYSRAILMPASTTLGPALAGLLAAA